MTEEEWLACDDPTKLLNSSPLEPSSRKPCLLACACCRRLWSELTVSHQAALDVAERYSDGLISGTERLAAFEAMGVQVQYHPVQSYVEYPHEFMTEAITSCLVQAAAVLFRTEGRRPLSLSETETKRRLCRIVECCRSALEEVVESRSQTTDESQHATDASHGILRRGWKWVVEVITGQTDSPGRSILKQEYAHQAALVRDIFGNPFRPVIFSLEWRTSTVVALASQMYESRDFGAMPILADALQDAGCDNEDVLSHCRGPGPHVRGCWVVDLVLGKE